MIDDKMKEFIFGDERPFESCHASTLIALVDGSILAAWFGGSKEGAEDVAIWCSKRSGGKWSFPVKVADEEGLPHWNPVLFQASSGRIFLFYKVGHLISQWYTRFITSDDGGDTWSQPQQLVEGDRGGRGPVKNKPICLNDGTWLAPASIEGDYWDAFVDISYDQGKSWVKSAMVPIHYRIKGGQKPNGTKFPVPEFSFRGKGVIQPTLWESKPGVVHMLLRSTDGFIYRSDSQDGGKTWCAAYRTSLPNNNSGIDVVRLDNGMLVLAYNPVGENWGPRTPLVLSSSVDNGETWEQVCVLENEEGEYSYPAIIGAHDEVMVTYTWKRERIAFWKISFDNNPTRLENSKAFGNLTITRMAPGDQKISVDFEYSGKTQEKNLLLRALIKNRESRKEIYRTTIEDAYSSFTVYNLRNGTDYLVEIEAEDKQSGEIVAQSHPRLFRTGFVPGTVINYIHTEDYTYDSSGRSIASPSLVRLPDGSLLASHDIYWRRGGQNLTKVFESKDDGNTWTYLSDVYPCFWGKLFVHNDNVYMLGTSTEYGALLIYESKDCGRTWSMPTTIIDGGSREKGGPHKAPMPVVNYNGRLWTAIDYGSWTIGGHASGVISAPVEKDLMDPNSWTVTPFLPYSSEWRGAIEGGNPGLLEGNVVITPAGELVNFLRYHTAGGIPEYGKAIMLNIDKDNPNSPLTFGKVIDFPGNMSKFTINYDDVGGKYYALVNRVTLDWVSQRNILTLISSPNLIDWKIERDVLNYQDNGWWEDHTKVGFQYVDWAFDGDDIIAACRSAINGANNFHDANYLTFHRFGNFRR